MAIATHVPKVPRRPAHAPVPLPDAPARADRPARGAVVAVAIGLTYVVGHDGTIGWRAVRVLVLWAVTVLVLRGRTTWGDLQRGAADVVAGAGALAVGVGISGPHLVKTGLAAMTVAGFLALGGGLVLLVSGAGALLRRMGRLWRPPAVAGLALATIVVLYALGQAVAATNAPPTTVDDETPADRGLVYEDVELTAADGVNLSGWYVPSRNGAAVALLHGAGSTRSGVLDHAEVLAGHGFGVLLYDARGHGHSDGRAMDFGWYGDADLAGALAFLQERADVRGGRIGAVGMSMGGEEAIGAMAGLPGLRAVVAEGATNRVAGDKAWEPDVFGWRGAVQQGLNWLTTRTVDLLTVADPPVTLRASAATAQRPLLMIAGGDVEAEAHAAAYVQAGAPEAVEVWVVPGAGHTGGLDTDPRGWEARVVSFLLEALDAGDGPATATEEE